jgi:WD40 repeat protein
LLLAGFAVLTVLALVAVSLATRNARDSSEQRALATGRRLMEQSRQYANTDPALAARLALAAQRVSPTPETRAQLLSTVSTTLRGTLRGHAAAVNSVAFTPDGKTLVSGGDDGTARLWDVAGRRQSASLDGLSGQVKTAVFSPDGNALVTSPEVRLWDAHTRNQTGALSGAGSPAVFSPDGDMIATSGRRGTVLLWDARTHQRVAALQVADSDDTAVPSRLAFSPDGSTLAVTLSNFLSSDREKAAVQLWDVREKRRTAGLNASGTCAVTVRWPLSPDTATPCSPWPSVRTARPWRAEARTAPYVCGTCGSARPWSC